MKSELKNWYARLNAMDFWFDLFIFISVCFCYSLVLSFSFLHLFGFRLVNIPTSQTINPFILLMVTFAGYCLQR